MPPTSDGFGPMGTPDLGRAERIARRERRDGDRYAAARLEQQGVQRAVESDRGDADLAALRDQLRWALDRIADLERAHARLIADMEARERALIDEVREAFSVFFGGMMNGRAAQPHH